MLLDFPPEIIYKIYLHCDPESRKELSKINRFLHELTKKKQTVTLLESWWLRMKCMNALLEFNNLWRQAMSTTFRYHDIKDIFEFVDRWEGVYIGIIVAFAIAWLGLDITNEKLLTVRKIKTFFIKKIGEIKTIIF